MTTETGSPKFAVLLRDVFEDDLEIFFVHQDDPEATTMAAFPARSREAFYEHWHKILANKTGTLRTILVDGVVAGNIVSWLDEGTRMIGYWIGRDFWGRGIATRALDAFCGLLATRPLYAHVAKHNLGSIRVLRKCGFVHVSDDVGEDGIDSSTYVLSAPA